MVSRIVISIAVALLCIASVASEVGEASGANVMGTASTPSTYRAGTFFVREGDVYRASHSRCRDAQAQEGIYIAAATLDPGSLLVWPVKKTEVPMFRDLTYAGIEDNEIVLTRDPGPSIRLPIKGAFAKYAILNIAGYRIILDIVYPDKIKARVRYAVKICRYR